MSASPINRRRAGTLTGLAAIIVVGSLGAGSAQAVPGFAFDERIAGATRLETAVEASKALYPTDKTGTDVVIASQFATVDGLTASYLAGLYNAPILYTETTAMPPSSKAELDRLGAKNLLLVGGVNVISQQLENDWKGAGFTVTRYGGDDRYDTAAKVAQAPDRDGVVYEPEKIFIASGTSFADALAVGPVAYARNYPILLTRADRVPPQTSAALAALQTPTQIVIGGSTVISNETGGAVGGDVRLGGEDRQHTAELVAEYAVRDEGFTFKNAALVGGANERAADALVAAPLAGSTGTPLLFIKGEDAVGPRAAGYLDRHSANLDDHGYVFGGPNAVTQKAADEASAAAQ